MLGSVLAEYLGLKPTFNASIVVGGPSLSATLKHAAEAIVSGQANIVLCCAGENRVSGQTETKLLKLLRLLAIRIMNSPMGPQYRAFMP